MKTEDLAISVNSVADAITASGVPGSDAVGTHVSSLTEAVMGITGALVRIAECMPDNTLQFNDANVLIGKAFNTVVNNEIEKQGVIQDVINNDFVLVCYFSWLDGSQTHSAVVRISDMTDWYIHDNAEQMKYSLEYGYMSKFK